MKRLILIALLSLALSATAAFAFDPSLVTKEGLGVKAEAEIGKFSLRDDVPTLTSQLYGAGASYGLVNTGTKINLSAGGASASIDKAFGDRDYSDVVPYLTLGASQQVYELFGVRLGVFAEGTYLFRLRDSHQGTTVTLNDTTLVRAGGVAQYTVMKDLDLYGGVTGQWLNTTAEADGEYMSIANRDKVGGFAGAKYTMGPYAFDVNAVAVDRVHVTTNFSYAF